MESIPFTVNSTIQHQVPSKALFTYMLWYCSFWSKYIFLKLIFCGDLQLGKIRDLTLTLKAFLFHILIFSFKLALSCFFVLFSLLQSSTYSYTSVNLFIKNSIKQKMADTMAQWLALWPHSKKVVRLQGRTDMFFPSLRVFSIVSG